MELKFSRQSFEKYSSNKFREYLPNGSRVVPYKRAGRQTDRHDEANEYFFRNFSKAPKNKSLPFDLHTPVLNPTKAQWLLFCPTLFRINSCSFCPHTVWIVPHDSPKKKSTFIVPRDSQKKSNYFRKQTSNESSLQPTRSVFSAKQGHKY